MRIRWTGAKVVRRVVGEYEWSRKTGFVQDVRDPELAAELLTSPGEKFVVEQDEPLVTLNGVGPQRVAELALAGIGTMADLTVLDEEGIERLTEGIWASEKQVRAWVKEARERLEREERNDEMDQQVSESANSNKEV